MHKEKAKIYGCTIYWDGKYLCVHHGKESVHHIARDMEDALAIARKLGERHPVSVEEEQVNEG